MSTYLNGFGFCFLLQEVVQSKSNAWVGSGAINVGDRAGGAAPQLWDRDTCSPNFKDKGQGLKPPDEVKLPIGMPAGECVADWHCRKTEGACCKYYFLLIVCFVMILLQIHFWAFNV